MASSTLVPVELRDVRLLLLVGAHDSVVAAVRINIFRLPVLRCLRPNDQPWLEHVVRDSITSLSRDDGWDKLGGDNVGFLVVLVEGDLVGCHPFVGPLLRLLVLSGRRVGVIDPVGLPLNGEPGALPGPAQCEEGRGRW